MKCQICVEKKSRNFKELNDECLCSKSNLESPYSAFSAHSPVFLSAKVVDDITASVAVIEKTIRSETFKSFIFKNEVPKRTDIHGGILASYDFHLDDEGTPKLIEINTNAGGFFLNYELLKTEQVCCTDKLVQSAGDLEGKIMDMFTREFAQISDRKLETVAIVDQNPKGQFLYPEFVICKEFLETRGVKTFILDEGELSVRGSTAFYGDVPIDLVYNRLTDFYFDGKEGARFLPLVDSQTTMLSPDPNDHLLFADKINLIHLQSPEIYGKILSEEEGNLLRKIIPQTVVVSPENEEYLWEKRKQYFFKPVNGFGSGGAYNGKGLTKRVWENIKSEKYVAQEIIRPSTKTKEIGGEKEPFKFDIRAYMYDGEILLLGARMYQGQTTNFRTPGGGFAPILIGGN